MRLRGRTLIYLGIGSLVAAMWVAAALLGGSSTRADASAGADAAGPGNPDLDRGAAMARPAPGFTLTDQFGRRVSLRSFRGRVVILAFTDAECTTICPLTTAAMLDAKRLLGAAGSRVSLVGIDANPRARAISFTRAYSSAHGMLHSWDFLTGPEASLRRVWRSYGVAVQIEAGQIDHTPALYVIGPTGMLRELYLTRLSYAGVTREAQLLAREASRLLPRHPRVRSHLSYAEVRPIAPRERFKAPALGGGSVTLGACGSARLYLFFDTWDSELFSHLKLDLDSLNRYTRVAGARGLPSLTAVDEATVEPSRGALPRLVHSLPHPLAYRVAIDRSGRVADGYGVRDEPWLVLISARGAILWFDDLSVSGWPSAGRLLSDVRAALQRRPPAGRSATAGGSPASAGDPPASATPAPLLALRRQGSHLLGSAGALMARLRALRGYPVLLDAWASWCTNCQAEAPLLAAAARRYGGRIAFLGVDTDDSPGAGAAFLASHRTGYPSYQAAIGQLGQLAQMPGLPTTLFIDRAGQVVHLHLGAYQSPQSLDHDITTYLER